MMEINIKHDLQQIEKTLNNLGKKVLEPALAKVLNAAGTKSKEDAVREVSIVQRVTQKKINERIKIARATKKFLRYRASIDSRGISYRSLGIVMEEYQGKTKSYQRFSHVGKGKNKHYDKEAFVRTGKNGNQQVFVRKGKERLPLKALRVGLFTPFSIALKKQRIIARNKVLKDLPWEIENLVIKEIQKNANRK